MMFQYGRRPCGRFLVFNRWTLQVEAATVVEDWSFVTQHTCGNLLVAGHYFTSHIHIWSLKTNEKVINHIPKSWCEI